MNRSVERKRTRTFDIVRNCLGSFKLMEGRWAGCVEGGARLGTLVVDKLECGDCLTHYVTVTCDLACEAFDRASDLVYLATTTAWSKKLFK
jgi:hypothetical protein